MMPIVFAIVGIVLICLGLLSVRTYPALAGAIFAIGMLLAFLGVGYTANQIRAKRSQTDGGDEENPHESDKDRG